MNFGSGSQGREVVPTILDFFHHKGNLAPNIELRHLGGKLRGDKGMSGRGIGTNGQQNILVLQFGSFILQLERNREGIHIASHFQSFADDVNCSPMLHIQRHC